MSTQENDRFAESLFARLDNLEPVVTADQFVEYQQGLLRYLSKAEWDEAQSLVLSAEKRFAGTLADTEAQDKLDMEAEYADIF